MLKNILFVIFITQCYSFQFEIETLAGYVGYYLNGRVFPSAATHPEWINTVIDDSRPQYTDEVTEAECTQLRTQFDNLECFVWGKTAAWSKAWPMVPTCGLKESWDSLQHRKNRECGEGQTCPPANTVTFGKIAPRGDQLFAMETDADGKKKYFYHNVALAEDAADERDYDHYYNVVDTSENKFFAYNTTMTVDLKYFFKKCWDEEDDRRGLGEL